MPRSVSLEARSLSAWLQGFFAPARPRARLFPLPSTAGAESLKGRLLLSAASFFGNELVGVDFGRPVDGSPTNWTAFGASSDATLSNLIDESGAATPFDLTIDYTGGGGLTSPVPFSGDQLPQHAQPLDLLSGNIWQSTGSSVELTFSDLVPGQAYEVYVFGGDTVNGNNLVTITGENQTTFNQVYIANQLAVNGELGNAGRTLESYAQAITASSTGTITISVTHPDSGFYGVAGVAIREGISGSSEPPVVDQIFTTSYATSGVPKILAPHATVSDADSADFDGGQFQVYYGAGATANDRLSIRNEGTAAGQVGASGGNLTFGGTPIGTYEGGVGTDPLLVTFNSAATPAIAQAVVRNVVYSNVSPNPTNSGANPFRIVAYRIHDGEGGVSAVISQTINITAANVVPVLDGIPSPQSYTENAPPKVLAPTGTVTDANNADFDGGVLTVKFTAGGRSTDRLAIRNQGTAAGQVSVVGSDVAVGGFYVATFTGGTGTTPLVITFNNQSKPGRVLAVLRNITYENTSDNPTSFGAAPARTVSYRITDGDGGTSAAVNQTLNITAANDQPALGGIAASLGYAENSGKPLTPTAIVADADSADFDGGKLIVKYAAGGLASDRLTIRNDGTAAGLVGVNGTDVTFGGTTIGTLAGGTGLQPLVVTFNAAATPARVQAVLRNLLYQNVSDNPTNYGANPTRSVSYSLTDGDGGAGAAFLQTLTVNPDNDRAVLGGIPSPQTYIENAAPKVLAPNATVADPDSANLATGLLTVKLTAGGLGTDRLTIRNQGTAAGQIGVSGNNVTFGGTTIGTFTGGTGLQVLSITFNTEATPVRVQALLRNILYENVSDNPTNFGASPSRTVTYTIADGDGGYYNTFTVDQTLQIVAVNDAPVIAGFDDPSTYAAGGPALILDANATVADADSTDFGGGVLTLAAPVGGAATNVFGVRNQGSGAGQIGVVGNDVQFAGVTIGTLDATAPAGTLKINLIATAAPAKVQALVRNLTFRSTAAQPTGPKTILLRITDGDGGTTTATKTLNIAPNAAAPPRTAQAFSAYADWQGAL